MPRALRGPLISIPPPGRDGITGINAYTRKQGRKGESGRRARQRAPWSRWSDGLSDSAKASSSRFEVACRLKRWGNSGVPGESRF